MANFDGYFVFEGQLILVQITTTDKKYLSGKLRDFENAVTDIVNARGWYVSLVDVPVTDTDIIITAGETLKHILGEAIYNRIIEVKAFLQA